MRSCVLNRAGHPTHTKHNADLVALSPSILACINFERILMRMPNDKFRHRLAPYKRLASTVHTSSPNIFPNGLRSTVKCSYSELCSPRLVVRPVHSIHTSFTR